MGEQILMETNQMQPVIETSPLTGETIRELTPPSVEDIHEIVLKGRAAFESWSKTSIKQRTDALKSLRRLMIDRLDEIIGVLRRSTGKVDMESLTSDVFATISMIDYYEKNAAEILAAKSAEAPAALIGNSFFVERSPLGLVLVISPWNFPLQLAMVPAITALTAGNAVVLKPSEVTLSVGELIQDLIDESDYPADLFKVVSGGPDVGKALINEKPDKIFFTGSVATGKKIMGAAAENIIPLELELGGKDPMIVFNDANIHRAVHGALYGGFSNAGQTCVSVERLYVQDKIYETFVEKLTKEACKIKLGSGKSGDIGPIIDPRQKDIIETHINDAIEKGAKATLALKKRDGFFSPVILRDADHTMKVMVEETFGPVLPVMMFRTEEDAVRLANDSEYGLNASVWSRDMEKARRVAKRLVTGNCAVNNVIVNISNPHTPFGGEKKSGFGRYHGPEGLYSFCRTKTIMVNRGLLKKEINWFPYTRSGYIAVKSLMKLLYGKNAIRDGAKKALKFLKGE